MNDPQIKGSISLVMLEELLNSSNYTGDAINRTKLFVSKSIEPILLKYKERIGIKSKVYY